ncbi:MAG: S1C family serine protease [Actinomycetota bacterium]
MKQEERALDAYSEVVTHVVELLAPAVANLRVYHRVRGGRQLDGGGSAVAITPDGFMITSAHVVAGSFGAVASFVDGRELEVEVVGADRLSDLAVVRTNGTLHSATLGDAAELKVGQLVVAMGNPLGFGGSVTAGIVSALGRSFATQAGSVTRFVENVIQTDAALHPGNSGGALANGRGEVVGINTALIGPAVGQGLGLAVPINVATRRIISALMSEGRVRRAYLGIVGGPRPLPPRVANATGRDRGIEVVEVVPASPAQQAGIRPEDLILEIDDVAVADMNDLQRVMDTTTIGRSVAVTVYRDGANLKLEVTPAELTG